MCRWASAIRSAAWPARSRCPTTPTGRSIDPNEINEALIESIIEVDEAVMERYFEGEVPSEEELGQADGAGDDQRLADADRLRVGQKRYWRRGAARYPRQRSPATHRHHAHRAPKTAIASRSNRTRRAAGRAGVQDSHRSVRAAAQLHPCLTPARSKKTRRVHDPTVHAKA